jgi:hypothetical protein
MASAFAWPFFLSWFLHVGLVESINREQDPCNGNAMKDFLQRLFRTRYVGLLEADVARLRAENRALMNSLLGTAGFPPVEFPEAPKAQPLPRLRKRSWHQLQAWRQGSANRDAAMNFDEKSPERPNGPVSHS